MRTKPIHPSLTAASSWLLCLLLSLATLISDLQTQKSFRYLLPEQSDTDPDDCDETHRKETASVPRRHQARRADPCADWVTGHPLPGVYCRLGSRPTAPRFVLPAVPSLRVPPCRLLC